MMCRLERGGGEGANGTAAQVMRVRTSQSCLARVKSAIITLKCAVVQGQSLHSFTSSGPSVLALRVRLQALVPAGLPSRPRRRSASRSPDR